MQTVRQTEKKKKTDSPPAVVLWPRLSPPHPGSARSARGRAAHGSTLERGPARDAEIPGTSVEQWFPKGEIKEHLTDLGVGTLLGGTKRKPITLGTNPDQHRASGARWYESGRSDLKTHVRWAKVSVDWTRRNCLNSLEGSQANVVAATPFRRPRMPAAHGRVYVASCSCNSSSQPKGLGVAQNLARAPFG